VTSWNRRLSAASARPVNRARTSRAEVLAEAMSAGVIEDDQSALMAMANIARDRPGFHKTLDVRARVGGELMDLVFEIVYDPEGPVVRLSTQSLPTAAVEALRPGNPDLELVDDTGVDVLAVLSDTLVETPDLVAVFASVGHEAIWANDAFVTHVPIRESDKVWLVELLDEWSKGHYEVKVLPALVKYGRWLGRLTLITGEDSQMPVSAVIVSHRDRQGEIEAISVVARRLDVDAEGPVGPDALVTDSRFAALVENASDIIAVLDHDGAIAYASPATARVLQHDQDALIGQQLLDLVDDEDRPEDLLALAQPDEHGIGAPVELRLRAADGSLRYLEVVVTDLTQNDSIGGLVLNARDITERVEAIQALTERALTDVLTGLPGRVRLLDRLSTALADPREVRVTALIVDIDHLRAVNEHFGHDVGDELLVRSAERLRATVGVHGLLARLGSDEFVAILPGSTAADGLALAIRLRDALSEPLDLEAGNFVVTASVGIATAGAGADSDPEAVLRKAERAVVQAKAAGRDRIEVYTDELAQLEVARLTTEQTLRHALDNDGVAVHYQPMVDLHTESVVAAEALLRVHANGNLLSPAAFIEAAESAGLIARLSSQVLEITCQQLAEWTSAGPGTGAGEIFVNISPRQLADPDLPTRVVGALEHAGVAPTKLWLEITESMLIGAQDTIDASIDYLRSLGVRIGLDDFGAGQSSLGYLKRFPLDFVKIDRSLIAGLGVHDHDAAIVRATIELAHNLGLLVVAVGVETDVQLEYLQLLGCDRAQGYRFAPALSASDLTAHVAG